MKLAGVRIVADTSIQEMHNAVTGANEADKHLVDVNPGRDFQTEEFFDLVTSEAGDGCPRCGNPLEVFRGIEVGQIFKLGTKYSDTMQATFQDEDGQNKPFVMGCYGIGITRTVAAAIEQNHDQDGIIWPLSIAPFQVLLTPTVMKDEAVVATTQELYDALHKAGIEVLYDDREDRAGVKFKDGDLIGIPWRVTIGPKGLKDGVVEIRSRRSGEVERVPVADAADRLRQHLEAAL